jgi:hypothetical protein
VQVTEIGQERRAAAVCVKEVESWVFFLGGEKGKWFTKFLKKKKKGNHFPKNVKVFLVKWKSFSV